MDERMFLRRVIATIAYRGGKLLKGAPDDFVNHDTGGGHTPLLLLSHIGDLLDWSLTHLNGEPRWTSAEPGTWESQSARFHDCLARLDARIAGEEPIRCHVGRLFSGPLADSLTHIGQLAMLRRLTGHKVYSENYFVAEIEIGRTGPDQAPPVKAF